MNIYLKAFIYSGLSFGIAMGVFYSFNFGIIKGAMVGTMAGLCFGGSMSLILCTFHFMVKKPKPKYSNIKSINHVKHEVNVLSNSSLDEAIDICKYALSQVKKSRVVEVDKEKGKILGKVSKSWKSFGEEVIFTLSTKSETSTHIKVYCGPSLRTTLIDYGKSLENLITIETFLLKSIRENE